MKSEEVVIRLAPDFLRLRAVRSGKWVPAGTPSGRFGTDISVPYKQHWRRGCFLPVPAEGTDHHAGLLRVCPPRNDDSTTGGKGGIYSTTRLSNAVSRSVKIEAADREGVASEYGEKAAAIGKNAASFRSSIF